jgi:pilus assembly protein CpaB
VVPTVTLDLTPDNAEKLVLAASKGSLQLLLRNVADASPVASRGATISKVLTGMETRPVLGIPRTAPARTAKIVQAKLSPAHHSVEIIEGTSRSFRDFGPIQ